MAINLNEKVLVKLDFHYARKTNAKTWWTFLDGSELPEPIYSTADSKKTHYYNYYILRYGEILLRHRISNRNNYSKMPIAVRNLIVSLNELPPEAKKRAIELLRK